MSLVAYISNGVRCQSSNDRVLIKCTTGRGGLERGVARQPAAETPAAPGAATRHPSKQPPTFSSAPRSPAGSVARPAPPGRGVAAGAAVSGRGHPGLLDRSGWWPWATTTLATRSWRFVSHRCCDHWSPSSQLFRFPTRPWGGPAPGRRHRGCPPPPWELGCACGTPAALQRPALRTRSDELPARGRPRPGGRGARAQGARWSTAPSSPLAEGASAACALVSGTWSDKPQKARLTGGGRPC